MADAEECIKINPTWSKGYGRKGAAYHGLGDLDSSETAYNEALKLDPNNSQAKTGLESVQNAKSRGAGGGGNGFGSMFSDPATFAKLANNARTKEFLKDPEFIAKLGELQKNPMAALTSASQDPRIMQAMSVILGIDLSEDSPMPDAPSEPENKTESAKAKEPKSEPEPEREPEPVVDEVADEKKKADEEKAKGNACYKSHKFAEAIEHYNAAWELHKDNTYLTNRAAAEFEKGDYDATIKTCLQAIEHGREQFADYKVMAKAFSRIGNAYLKKDDLKNAIEYFNKSLTEHRTPETLSKLRQAEKDFRKREQESYIDPTKADEAREEGNKCFKEGDWPGAVKAYSEAIKRSPEDPRGYANRAAALLKLLSYPEVVKDCDTAIEKDPNFFKAYSRKATAYLVMHEYRKCIDTLEQARSIDKENKHSREIDEIYQKAISGRFQNQEGETPEQALERASKDPEIVEILQDPIMNSILQQAQGNPAALADHMKNPEVRRKVNLLIAAGIIRTR